MKVSAKRKPYDEINITPMLDLAYVLLIIFIIMTTAAACSAPRSISARSTARRSR